MRGYEQVGLHPVSCHTIEQHLVFVTFTMYFSNQATSRKYDTESSPQFEGGICGDEHVSDLFWRRLAHLVSLEARQLTDTALLVGATGDGFIILPEAATAQLLIFCLIWQFDSGS